ncbi:MAG TPA: hypothetical protein VMX97_02675, partial [Hyphomicrobiaceae bacterium]|nr:hypothetical protein [Hyphomicrobiaceae bacterium]
MDTSTAEAYIGASTNTISVSPTNVTITDGGVDVDAKLNSTVEAKTKVTSIGLIGIAGSKTNSESRPTVLSYLGDKANVTATLGAVTFDAASTSTAVTEGSELAAGAIAVSFTTVTAKVQPTVAAFTESGGSITAGSGHIISKSVTNVSSKIDASSGGVVAVSGMTSTAELTNRNTAAVGEGTEIAVVDDFTLRADSNNTGKSVATNGSGGVVAVNLATADLMIEDYSTVELGTGAGIRAGNNLILESLVTATADSDATVNNGGFVASPNSDATTTLNVTANANLMSNINLRGENVTIRAEITKIDADARAKSSVGAAVPIARSESTVDTNTSALITLASMAPADSITAQGTLSIIAKQIELSTFAKATADADGFAGTKSAEATTIQKSTTRITADDQTRLATRNLLVKADSDFLPLITADANTPGFVLFSSDSEDENRTFSQKREIDFSAKVSLLGAPSPELLIDENGKVLTKKNLTLNNDTVQVGDTYTGDIVVDDILNNDPLAIGKVEFVIPQVYYDTASKPGGFTTTALIQGNPEFIFITGFERVNITSAADQNLYINDIDVINPMSQFTQNVIVNVANKSAFTPLIKDPVPGNTLINITNTGVREILFTGKVDSPFGTTRITNNGGDILATNTNAEIISAQLYLDAASGQVGMNDVPIKTQTGPDSLSGTAITDFFVFETGNLDVNTIVAGGTVDLRATGSIRDSRDRDSGDDDTVNITAPTIRLFSQSGGIGDNGSLEIDATDEMAQALFATADGDIVINDLNGALYLGAITSNNGNIAITVDDSVGPGDDLVLTSTTRVRAVNGTITLLSGDDFIAPADSLIHGANGVTIGGDANDADVGVGAAIDLSGTISGSSVLVQGGSDVDRIALVGIQAATTIELGGGKDFIHIGSNATPTTNTNGTLADVDALLKVIGLDDGDTLSLDDTGSAGPRGGTLTSTTLSGLAMSGSIAYTGASNLDLNLGSFTDTLLVTSTDAETVTTVDLGGGMNSVTVSDAGLLDSISGILSILGGSAMDILSIDDSLDADMAQGVLDVATRASLIGFGMGAADNETPNDQKGIRYSDFEIVSIQLGQGVDQFTIGGVRGATMVDLGGGDDKVSVGPSLSGISAPLMLRGGAGANTLSIDPGVAASLTLDQVSVTQGLITAGAAAGVIGYESMDSLTFNLAGTDDKLEIRDTTVPVTVNANGGKDMIIVATVSHLTELNLGDGNDQVTIRGAGAPIAVHASDAAGDDDQLIIDLSAETAVIDGAIRGGGADPTIPGFDPAVDATANTGFVSVTDSAFITMSDIYFDDAEKVSVLLGTGNDIFDIDSRFADPANGGALTDAFIDTVVSVDGGAGNDDIYALAIASQADTNVAGGNNEDELFVPIAGFPVADSFTRLNIDIETLIIDNSSYGGNPTDVAVTWTQQDGDLLKARELGQPESSNFEVISTQGAEVVRIVGSQLSDALDVITTSAGDVDGRIVGNRIELRSGLEVATFADVDQFQNFDEVIGFYGMPT